MNTFKFGLEISDKELEDIAITHHYKSELENPEFDGKKDEGEDNLRFLPNPISAKDFALDLLNRKIASMFSHELNAPRFLQGNISQNRFEKLKHDRTANILNNLAKCANE